MKKVLCIGIFFLAVLGFSTFGSAELIVNGTDTFGGNRLIYDTLLDITWYDSPAEWLTFLQAQTWATSLNVGGVTGWRLTHAYPINGSSYNWAYSSNGSTDIAHNISAHDSAYPGSKASEMAHLHFTTLGNDSEYAVDGTHTSDKSGLKNKGPFLNLENSWYWSGTNYGPDSNSAVYFGFVTGLQWAGPKETETRYALAVHDGNVAAPVVERTIDIQPGDATNTINTRRMKTITVAVISTPDFYAPSVNRSSLTFGATGDEDSLIKCAARDRNVGGDAQKDLVCTFSTSLANLCGVTVGTLRGQIDADTWFEGSQNITVTGCR